VSEFEAGDIAMDAVARRCRRVLYAVGELHRRGYQRIRIAPGLAPGGAYWRCVVTPIANITELHGARAAAYDEAHVARYTTADSTLFFGWEDRRAASARQLADTFLERRIDLAALGRGRDWAYVGWFTELLGHADDGLFPVAIEEAGRDDVIVLRAPARTDGGEERPPRLFPLPPPGDARPA
jgi:hypothetical protein